MKVTIGPLMPDGMPINLDVDEAWLAQKMAEPGKSAGEVIGDELDRGLEAGMKKMADAQRKAIEDMQWRAAHQEADDAG